MKYKDYEAAIQFDEDANIIHGEVINTRDVITFHGTSVKDRPHPMSIGHG